MNFRLYGTWNLHSSVCNVSMSFKCCHMDSCLQCMNCCFIKAIWKQVGECTKNKLRTLRTVEAEVSIVD